MAKNKQGRMPHLSVTQKLWLGVATMVVGSIVIAGMAGVQSAQHQKSFTAHEQVLAARLAQAVQWQSLAQVNMVRTQAQVLGQASGQGQPFAQRIATTGQEIEGLVQALQASAQTPQDKLQLQQVQQLREQALQQRQKIFAADGDATSQIAQTYLPAAQAYLQGIEGLVQHTGQSLAALRSEMGAARQGVVRGAVINMLVLLAFIALGAYQLINGIRRDLQQANAVAGQIAAGDLAVAVQVQRQDEFGQLLQSMQSMSGSLAQMLSEVRDSGDTIALASAEIAGGNHDLSLRTEQTSTICSKRQGLCRHWCKPCKPRRMGRSRRPSWPAKRPVWPSVAGRWWGKWWRRCRTFMPIVKKLPTSPA